MSYLAVEEAVRARLLGNPPGYVPPYPLPTVLQEREHEQPSRVDDGDGTVEIPAEYNTKAVVPDTIVGIEVPVYKFDVDGHYWKQNYPCLTYEVIGVLPRYTEFLYSNIAYGGEVYVEDVLPSRETVVDNVDDTDLGEGAGMFYVREVEHPFDILVEVRAYSRVLTYSAVLTSYVYRVLEPRGFLRVPHKDGTYRSWDMLFQSFADLDKREAVASGTPGVEREYAKVWTYVVEGYLDNTDTRTLVHRTRSRIIRQTGAEG